ncbi:MAG TPA: TetR/AcrR family transcriptional regulator [Clostridia bacterium]
MKKGVMTKTALLNTAKELFSEKGYSAVTMKDFCERSGLSRGGLYRHFASTKEIFIELLNFDKENASAELDKAISDEISAKQVLIYFLNKQKQEIQNGIGSLSIAVYEFCTTQVEKNDYMDKRFASAVDTLVRLIKYGQSQHEFKSCDSEETARHIVIFLEGLKLSSVVVSLTESMIEEQLKIIYEMVVCNDK